MYLPIIIIVIVVLIITATFVGFGIKLLLSHFKDNDPQSLETVTFRNSIHPGPCDFDRGVQAGTSLLTPERDQRRPTSQEVSLDPPELPSHPPSYDEVVGIGYRDDPPQYSELSQVVQ